MNLRFPEVFGLVLFVVVLCSFALPRSVSGRVENTFQFVFAPVTGPIQWMTSGRGEKPRPETPIFTETSDEVSRLRAEKLALTNYIEILRGQVDTLKDRDTEAGRIGNELGGQATVVKVIGVDGAGRDVLRLAGTSSGVIEKDQPVVTSNGLVGRVQEVGLGNQSSVRLITDRGFKLVAKFGRYEAVGDNAAQLTRVELGETLVEGAGNGVMRIISLTKAQVQSSGLRLKDIVLLSDVKTAAWPIEVHGYRVGTITNIGEKLDMPGVADITVTPDADLLKLKEVWIVTHK